MTEISFSAFWTEEATSTDLPRFSMCFWQEWINGCAMNGFTGIVKHADFGWPPVSSEGWDALRTRFLNSIEVIIWGRLLRLAATRRINGLVDLDYSLKGTRDSSRVYRFFGQGTSGTAVAEQFRNPFRIIQLLTKCQGGKAMAKVYVEALPKGRPEGSAIQDYAVEDHANHELGTFKTQKEAIDWAHAQGHAPLIARVRHLNDRKIPDHWRSA